MKGFIVSLIFFAIIPAHAGIVILGTRAIFPAEKNEIVIQLINKGDNASLVQSWVDDGDTSLPPEKIQVPFLLSPPVIRVKGNSGQQLKIKKISNNLPTYKESLFYLNVLDIPPNTPMDTGKNVVKFAMQNRIKMFYRPKGLSGVGKGTFSGLNIKRNASGLILKNNTANWVTVVDVKINAKKINKKTIMTAPFSEESLGFKIEGLNNFSVTIIDDYGNYISDKIAVK